MEHLPDYTIAQFGDTLAQIFHRQTERKQPRIFHFEAAIKIGETPTAGIIN